MSKTITERLAAMGIVLDGYREPISRYKPVIRTGNLLYFSGQLSAMEYDGAICGITGQLGSQIGVEQGYDAARSCATGLLNRAYTALGDLNRIRQLVRLTGYINSGPGFTEQHLVLNGCSDVLIAALGEAGTHTRLAIGIGGLSFNASVEVDCIMEVA
ncbi:enamine deaminase RidA (YjgF/YER057c/UK114 family) [Pararhizobium capsulatum DSM 1112]|uniref:Enamine deaminase RidA (YjgF/YER057c/UK114 family) n=1 Tax=Pararhizobium capsulatum DSM 1112 TaxID=1121113 RepID=A0ABU0C038_9HYPH|nr:RidA family protein [Pararhizobium capsulatum]MDQ0323876.1 enamine deaminase RidA (YjgF/YER057c/UK114 family) [Pararhizobium capsulatum DSM 1112]